MSDMFSCRTDIMTDLKKNYIQACTIKNSSYIVFQSEMKEKRHCIKIVKFPNSENYRSFMTELSYWRHRLLFFFFLPETASIYLENKSHAMPAFKIKNLGYGGYLKFPRVD